VDHKSKCCIGFKDNNEISKQKPYQIWFGSGGIFFCRASFATLTAMKTVKKNSRLFVWVRTARKSTTIARITTDF